jgi:hypothetical protein
MWESVIPYDNTTYEPSMLLVALLTQYCSGDEIEKNEMRGACSTMGGEERCIQGFGGET